MLARALSVPYPQGLEPPSIKDRDEPAAQYGSSSDSPLEEPGFKPRVPGATGSRRVRLGGGAASDRTTPLFRRRALAQQGSSHPVRAYIGLKSWASLAALPLGKSSIAVRSDLMICSGSPRSAQSSNLATSSPSSSGLSGPPRFTITASMS